MKFNAKRILSVILCLATVLSLASCKQQPNEPGTITTVPTDTTTVPSAEVVSNETTTVTEPTTVATTEPTTVATTTEPTTVTTTEVTTTTSEATMTTTESTTVTTTKATTAATTVTTYKAPDKNYKPTGNELRFEHNGVTYYNVLVASAGFSGGYNDDEYFPEGEQGYYIASGTFNVSAEVFNRIITVPCFGDGAIKYNKWRRVNYTEGDTHLFDGVLPASRMDDPIYVSMCAPSEGRNYLSEEHKTANGDTNVNTKKSHINITPIGAIYLSYDHKDLPNNTEITLCFGKIYCAVKYKGREWKLVNDELPPELDNMYPIPWQLEFVENPVSINKIPSRRIKDMGDHWEITLRISDFKARSWEDSRLLERVLHFWGNIYKFENDGKTGGDVEGIACCYQVWIKEKEYEGVLLADIGADQRDKNGQVGQAFNTKAYEITTEKRFVLGHNVCPNCYDKVMDSDKLQELFGMK